MSKKNDQPYMPFYFGDWFKAMDVQSLSRETKCVWFEMLGRMWESNERGYLTINGRSMSDFAIAKILGFGDDVESYRHHEKILEENGIFSRRSDGAIYSRFMVKMIDISEKKKASGAKGASVRYSKKEDDAIARTIANSDIDIDNETDNDIDALKETKIGEEDFNTLWLKYPNRQGKKNALRHFLATVRTSADVSNICQAIENYISSGNVKKGFIKNGSTWFNEWQDWIDPTPQMMKGTGHGTNSNSPHRYAPQAGSQAARLAYDPNAPEVIEKFRNLKETLDARDRERLQRSATD